MQISLTQILSRVPQTNQEYQVVRARLARQAVGQEALNSDLIKRDGGNIWLRALRFNELKTRGDSLSTEEISERVNLEKWFDDASGRFVNKFIDRFPNETAALTLSGLTLRDFFDDYLRGCFELVGLQQATVSHFLLNPTYLHPAIQPDIQKFNERVSLYPRALGILQNALRQFFNC